MTQVAPNPVAEQRAASRPAGCACTHCGLPVPKGLIEAGRAEQFCCHACASAYEIIHGCGLDAYYRLRQQDDKQSTRPKETDSERLAVFDSEKFQEIYVRTPDSGGCAVDLLLEGVHCAACVWLIEKLPRILPGVIESRLSLRDATVRIVWDPKQVTLSEIARALGTLGYNAHPARHGGKKHLRLVEQRAMLVRLGVAGAIAANTMLLAFALYAGLFSGMEERYVSFFRWISAGLGVLSLAWPGRVFFRGALVALRTRSPHLDLPIALALGVGGIAGAVNVVLGRGEIYFDSLTVLVFLLLVGRYIQYTQQRRADESVGLLLSLVPTNCRRLRDTNPGSASEQVPLEAIRVGDLLEVRSGELIPADGVVIKGSASMIAALITGESRPVSVGQGDDVVAGARLCGATILVRVTAVGQDARIGKLMSLVERGLADKPTIVALTDRIAGWFVVAVSSIALLVFLAWSLIDLSKAVDHTVALLIIACPCALGLATPLSLAVTIGRAAKRDILIKSGAAMDRLARPGRLLIDKTGTITRGAMRVEHWLGDTSLQPIVAEVQRHATHPIAQAIVECYGEQELPAGARTALADIRIQPAGVTARTDKGKLVIGSQAHMNAHGISVLPKHLEQAGQWAKDALTPVFVAIEDQTVAVMGVGDGLHSDAVESIAQLKRWGWQVQMLTGDERAVADTIGRRVGLAAQDIVANVTPEEKLAAVKDRSDLRATVMVGDGVNDSAALAAADVGVAVSGGAEASLAAADIYLARPGLAALTDLIATARRSRSVIKRNLTVSLFYNAVAIMLAALGYINPLVAAVLMPASSILVLGLAMHGSGLIQKTDTHAKAHIP